MGLLTVVFASSAAVGCGALPLPGGKKPSAGVQPMSSQCNADARKLITSVRESYYPEFQKKGPDDTVVWFARKDLEEARYAMSPKLGQGWRTNSAPCFDRDLATPEYAQMRKEFGDAEKMLRDMESAKGVTFNGVEHLANGGNHIVYLDKNGQAVARSDRF